MSRLAAAFQDRYRIEREIGSGGMATVYLAQDLRHDRKVAIKVLHPELAAAIGAERFLAEIKVTANLQHPHILPLHDSGMLDTSARDALEGPSTILYYVMPFVQGESLRDRLQRERQLPIADAVAIARDVAAALDYAHRQGVIHRDIKPENILLHEGRPLVADFGIALAVSAAGSARMTHTGLSLGTPHYMSPEQAMGDRSLDARADIYALGAVLYEMLTGEPPFTGASVQAILAKVMTERPMPPSTVRDTVPAHIESAVLTALAKLPADRFASAGAFANALTQPTDAYATGKRRLAGASAAPLWLRVIAVAALAALMLVPLGMLLSNRSSTAAAGPVMRFEVVIPDSLDVQKVILTPDGTRLLLSTNNHGPFVYTFADARLAPLEIAGGNAIQDVDITPDGSTLVFREGRVLKTMPVAGGPVRTVADSVSTVRVGDDGYVYSRNRFTGIRRVSLQTGASAPIAMRDSTQFAMDSIFGEVGEPIPVPGGRGVVFAVGIYAPPSMQIVVLDLRTGAVTRLPHPEMHTALPIGFSPTGHLLFRGPDAVYAIRFDTRTLQAEGAPERVVGSMPGQTGSCGTMACTGEAFNGQSFAYLAPPSATPALVNRQGAWSSLPNIPPNLSFLTAVASPDGRKLLHQVGDLRTQRLDVWTYQMPEGPLTRITSADDEFFWSPRWTADGRSIRYAGAGKDSEALYTVPSDGSQPPKPMSTRLAGFAFSVTHHPDGKRIATNTCLSNKASMKCGSEGFGLVVFNLDQPDSLLVIGDRRSGARSGEFSPDGRWLAYLAQQGDRRELYVRGLDSNPARWQVSRNGANTPRWSHDSKTIFFVANDSLFAADWRPETEPRVGAVRALFRLGVLGAAAYDVLPGDTSFVMIAPNQAERTRIVVIANFVEQLRDLNRARR